MNNKKFKDNKNIISLFIFLALILAITSSIVCYIIGKNSRINTSGTIKNTIIITEPQNTSEFPIYLTGKIVNKDNEPYQGKIRLYSKMKETVSDKNGVFLFNNLLCGSHTLVVLDENNNVLKELKISFNHSTTNDKPVVKKKNDSYEIYFGINIALIEIELIIDEDKNDLYINEDNISVINYNGKVITKDKTITIDNKIINTNMGNKVLPEGLIVVPNKGVILSNGTFISNSGEINFPEKIKSLPDSVSIKEDGSIVVLKQLIIKKDGTIFYLEKIDKDPIEQEEKPIDKDPIEEKEDEPKDEIKPNPNSDPEIDPEPIPESDPTPEPEHEDPEIEEPDPLTWDRPIVSEGNVKWSELASLDIFSDNDSQIPGKIYPGVSGKYEFNIENINPYNVEFSLNMQEQVHDAGSINLAYRLKYYDNYIEDYVYVIGNSDKYLKSSELITTDKVIIRSNSKISYILEWKWINENNKNQDIKDGYVGSNNNKTHYIDMIIHVENSKK